MARVYLLTETLAVGSARQSAAFSILEHSKALPTLHRMALTIRSVGSAHPTNFQDFQRSILA